MSDVDQLTVDDDGHTYCCMGCARQTGCTCR